MTDVRPARDGRGVPRRRRRHLLPHRRHARRARRRGAERARPARPRAAARAAHARRARGRDGRRGRARRAARRARPARARGTERVRPATGALTGEAAARYDRQMPYFAAASPAVGGAAAQRRLLDATVTIVGCGALGSWTAAGLACAGVGRLVLVDDDTVELSNLNRQLLFRRSDVGRAKVDAAHDALEAFNADLVVERVPLRVRSAADVDRVAEGADLIVATADDPPYAIERWCNEVAFARGIPHVSASQFPPHVRVGPLVRPGDHRLRRVPAPRGAPRLPRLRGPGPLPRDPPPHGDRARPARRARRRGPLDRRDPPAHRRRHAGDRGLRAHHRLARPVDGARARAARRGVPALRLRSDRRTFARRSARQAGRPQPRRTRRH